MKLKDSARVVLMIVVLQGCLGVAIFTLVERPPGVSVYTAGLGIAVLITVSSIIGIGLYWLFKRPTQKRAIKTAMNAMSEDEQKVLREVMVAGEIRQSKLRKNLGFSKSKLSALLNNLEEKNAVEKVHFRGINLVRPTEQFQK